MTQAFEFRRADIRMIATPEAFEIGHQLVGILVAVFGILLQALQAHRLIVLRDTRIDFTWWRRSDMDVLIDDAGRVVAREWQTTSQKLIEDHAQSVQIRT